MKVRKRVVQRVITRATKKGGGREVNSHFPSTKKEEGRGKKKYHNYCGEEGKRREDGSVARAMFILGLFAFFSLSLSSFFCPKDILWHPRRSGCGGGGGGCGGKPTPSSSSFKTTLLLPRPEWVGKAQSISSFSLFFRVDPRPDPIHAARRRGGNLDDDDAPRFPIKEGL